MEPSAELKAMPIANTPKPEVSTEGQAAAGRIAAARAERNANPTSVTADQLSQPVSQVTVPQPVVAETTPVNDNMVKGVGENTQNIITAKTQEAADLKALRDQQAQIAGEGTLSELFSSQQEQFGIPDNLKTLQDLQLQLSEANTASDITQTRIGQGNSIAQGNREITQEVRENAIRNAGTAARAAIISGNIETASALVSQAVQTAYQDRTLRNSNLINQINSLQGVVDNQTSQLLETDKREYEADQAAITRIQDAVDDAMNSGAATQEDIRTLTDPKLSDEDRLAAAQGIVSRGQTEMRDLDVRQSEASIASSQASTANSYDQIQSRAVAARERVVQLASESASEQEIVDAEKESAAEQQLGINAQLDLVMNSAGKNDAVGVGFKKNVVSVLPFVGGDALAGTSRADFETNANRLSDMFLVENLDKMSGVLTDKDMEVLRSEGTTIGNFDQSEESWDLEATRLKSMVQRGILENGITAEQAVFYGFVDEEDVETLEALWPNL